MMYRRQALVAIGIAALGGAELSKSADNQLNADLARAGSRVYSEEGVAMFLACENVVENGAATKEAPVSSALNQKVAAAFQRYADQWRQARPDAPAGDVAKILEFVAERDLASGGTKASL